MLVLECWWKRLCIWHVFFVEHKKFGLCKFIKHTSYIFLFDIEIFMSKEYKKFDQRKSLAKSRNDDFFFNFTYLNIAR